MYSHADGSKAIPRRSQCEISNPDTSTLLTRAQASMRMEVVSDLECVNDCVQFTISLYCTELYLPLLHRLCASPIK